MQREVKRRGWRFLGHALRVPKRISLCHNTHLDTYGHIEKESRLPQNNLASPGVEKERTIAGWKP